LLARFYHSPVDRLQARLLNLAALFLACYALALTLAPAVRQRSLSAGLNWEHWAGFLLWLLLMNLAHWQTARWLPNRDPYLLPSAGLLSGLGVLVTWRLLPYFGLRQSAWLLVSVTLLIAGLRLPADLHFLRRYKYLWLTSGLLLTSLTFFFGVNPSGDGLIELWLGCCGVYLQPSEPLKLLLVIYLAAYLADRLVFIQGRPGGFYLTSLLPLLAPTLIMTGVAILLLTGQRDLGTATVFMFLYAVTVYVASGKRRMLLASLGGLALAGVLGYLLFDVVQIRIDAWLNPWLDPSGRSYQIIQSLLAVASGGISGRGPGLGSPGLVPVPHSDFVFASVAEETGLAGALGLLALLALVTARGIHTALAAPDAFRRYLAAGLTAFLVGQSILIIGGNLRLLPLTGVTLPFVSYGGSSLLVSFFSLLLLLHISNQAEFRPAPLADASPYLHLAGLLYAGLAGAALACGWWAVVRGPDLLTRTDNPRRAIADRFVRRGALVDRGNQPINATVGVPGELERRYFYPNLSPVTGYNSPIYGQSGLEASLDGVLRGLQGNPGLTIWLDHVLYGQPPPGLDVRLSLDLELQRQVDRLLAGRNGAAVLLNAATGEVLAMASHPNFDANTLEQNWQQFLNDPAAPLLNRATQGLYPPGTALAPFLLAEALAQGQSLPARLPAEARQPAQAAPGQVLRCSRPAGNEEGTSIDLRSALSSACPGALQALAGQVGTPRLLDVFQQLGFFSAPAIDLQAALPPDRAAITPTTGLALGSGLAVSPLQMALAAAAISGAGMRPQPQLVLAHNLPQSGWTVNSLEHPAQRVFPALAASRAAGMLTSQDGHTWQVVAQAVDPQGGQLTWFIGGMLPEYQGDPLALALVLEADDPETAAAAGQAILNAAGLR
jgi:cell division protein FtsW (lipid II flippase)